MTMQAQLRYRYQTFRGFAFARAAAIAAMFALVTNAEEKDSPTANLEALRRAEAARTVSSDGSIAVCGEAFSYADRSVIAGFLADFRDALEHEVFGSSVSRERGFAFGPEDYRVSVIAAEQDETDNETADTDERSKTPGNTPPTHATLVSELMPRAHGEPPRTTLAIFVHGPASSLDSHNLASSVADGFIRLAVLCAARDSMAVGRPSAHPTPPPRWFADGLARLSDPALRQGDFDAVSAKWTSAGIPPLPVISRFDSPWAESDSAVAAQLVAFWLSFPDRATRFKALISKLSGGIPWSPDLFLLTSVGGTDSAVGDAAFDRFMTARASRVLTPGAASPEGAARLLSSLRLVPGVGPVPSNAGTGTLPPESVFRPENASWSTAAAKMLERRIRVAAAGRGDAWRAACGEMADALAVVASGKRKRMAEAELRFKAGARALAVAADEPAQ